MPPLEHHIEFRWGGWAGNSLALTLRKQLHAAGDDGDVAILRGRRGQRTSVDQERPIARQAVALIGSRDFYRFSERHGETDLDSGGGHGGTGVNRPAVEIAANLRRDRLERLAAHARRFNA